MLYELPCTSVSASASTRLRVHVTGLVTEAVRQRRRRNGDGAREGDEAEQIDAELALLKACLDLFQTAVIAAKHNRREGCGPALSDAVIEAALNIGEAERRVILAALVEVRDLLLETSVRSEYW
jgi:hypothetical protein